MPKINVVEGDILEYKADVVVFKYAQRFYGADAAAAEKLTSTGVVSESEISPQLGSHILIRNQGRLASEYTLFLGVDPMQSFGYGEIRQFTSHAIEVISKELDSNLHIAMTIHGVGFGLDERESFLSQIGGILDSNSSTFERITIVDRSPQRAQRLQQYLDSATSIEKTTSHKQEAVTRIDAGITSKTKKHVFVAMPFAEEFEDTYVFGIQTPINNAGLLCERVDLTVFTGDILDRVKSRIESATLVVADLTGSNANVFLEVGYAWGCNRQTLLLSHESHDLPFDVRGQRCIKYKNIVDLSKKLTHDLAILELT